ncbi:MAG: porin, partial [Burkholderiales bacterium]|nr:porin [Burkholderiales bacterium]
GLSGGFGALRIGKQYSNAFMNTLGMDPAGATGLAGNNAYVIQLAHGSDAPLRQSNGLQYDLPEMLPGLKVGATVVFGEKTSKAGDGNGFNISYTSGPFYAGYTFDRVKNTGISLLAANDVSSAGSNELTTMSASYDLGVAKVSINNTKMSVDSKSADNTFVAVSVPFGGNANVWASMSKGSAHRTLSNISYGNKDHEGFQVGVNYALSKRTVLYAQYGQMELESGLAANKKFEQTGSAIGVHHSF